MLVPVLGSHVTYSAVGSAENGLQLAPPYLVQHCKLQVTVMRPAECV